MVYYIVNGAPVNTDAHFARIVKDVAASHSIKTVVVNAFWYSRGVHARQLSATLETLSRAKKTIFVTDDVPFFSFDAFECKYRQALLMPTDCSADARQFERERARYYPELLSTIRRVPRAHMLNTAHYFCGEATCDMARNGLLLYRDSNHLNINGSRFLARRILDDYPAFVAAVTPGRSSSELPMLSRADAAYHLSPRLVHPRDRHAPDVDAGKERHGEDAHERRARLRSRIAAPRPLVPS